MPIPVVVDKLFLRSVNYSVSSQSGSIQEASWICMSSAVSRELYATKIFLGWGYFWVGENVRFGMVILKIKFLAETCLYVLHMGIFYKFLLL